MQKTDNRTTGGRFEQDLSNILAEHGFWVHVMQQNKAGQPADIIAIKGHLHTLIDCKIVSNSGGFSFERVEENQRLAMRMFQKKAGELCWFAIRLPDESIWMIPLERIEILKGRGNRRITEQQIRGSTSAIDEWLKRAEKWADKKHEYDDIEPDLY